MVDWLLLLWAAVAPVPSTCVPPPLETQVAKASVIIDGTVERVVYLRPDGTPEAEPRRPEPRRRETSLCGPKLVTFAVGQRLKGEVGDRLTVFAEDGCEGLGGHYRAGDAVVEFAYARTEPGRGAWTTDAPGVVPMNVPFYVHACGGTRRVRTEGKPVRGVGPAGHERYVTEILSLVSRLGLR